MPNAFSKILLKGALIYLIIKIMFLNKLKLKRAKKNFKPSGNYFSAGAGFTLVEVVVALGIFSIATTYAVSIFVQSNQVQKRTANIQKITSDARYVLEVMSREVRLDHLDYNYAGYTLPLTGAQAELALLDVNNQPVRFKRTDDGTGRFIVQVCEADNCDNDVYYDITPNDLTVEKLDFYVSPAADPFVWEAQQGGYANNQQPRVTIIMQTRSTRADLPIPKVINFQTTVTERKYAR